MRLDIHHMLSQEMRDILIGIQAAADDLDQPVYLVGGCVRDMILNKPFQDLDVVTVGSGLALASHFSQRVQGGCKEHQEFLTATVMLAAHHIDFVTARKETYACPGAYPEVTPGSLADDVFRRDFSMNALAVSLNQEDIGKVHDFCSGLEDIEKKQIRVLHQNSFQDDPTRIFRAARFKTRFDFDIEMNTRSWLDEALEEGVLSRVSAYRIGLEKKKIAQEPDPRACMKCLRDWGGSAIMNHL